LISNYTGGSRRSSLLTSPSSRSVNAFAYTPLFSASTSLLALTQQRQVKTTNRATHDDYLHIKRLRSTIDHAPESLTEYPAERPILSIAVDGLPTSGAMWKRLPIHNRPRDPVISHPVLIDTSLDRETLDELPNISDLQNRRDARLDSPPIQRNEDNLKGLPPLPM
jgi:hypothetical protein